MVLATLKMVNHCEIAYTHQIGSSKQQRAKKKERKKRCSPNLKANLGANAAVDTASLKDKCHGIRDKLVE